jgi:hypothetical protein
LIGRLRASLRSAGAHWGMTPEEEAARYPCDDVLPDVDQWLFRAVDVAAPAPLVYRWLCQLRAAPYSYDWIDNLGRRSPRTLTAGLDDIRPGQRAVTIFTIVDVEPGESLTVHAPKSIFGEVAGTYRVIPVGDDRSRLVAKLGVVYPSGLHGELMRDTLPLGDFIMMRKQLRTLASLAERDAPSAHGG